jgi:D-alanyl-D-alanine carboxypeptidase
MRLLLAAALAMALPAPAPGAIATKDGLHLTKLCETAAARIDAAAAKTMAQGSPGMIIEVAKNSELLFSGTYGHADLEQKTPVTRDTVFKLASITKEFTAATILTLVEEGKLKFDDTVGQHVPEFTAAANVKLYELLVQTSGIPDYAEDPAGAKTKSIAKTPEEMLAWIIELTPRLEFQPGRKWAYSNSNYVLLGLIAERVTGQPLATLFRERLFKPAGMTSTAFDDPADVVPNRAHGYRRSKDAPSGFRNAAWISPTIPGPAGGLRGTAQDLLRWKSALFGGRILKPQSLKTIVAPGVLLDGRTTKFGMPEDWQKGLNSDYGMGVFIRPTKGGTRIGHSGDIDGFSTWVAHYPASGVTVVQMINSQSADLNVDAVEEAIFSGSKNAPCIHQSYRSDVGQFRLAGSKGQP